MAAGKLSLADLDDSTLVAGPADSEPRKAKLSAADLEGSEVVNAAPPPLKFSAAAAERIVGRRHVNIDAQPGVLPGEVEDREAPGGLRSLITGERPPERTFTPGQSALMGAGQGASLGFADELMAGAGTLASKIPYREKIIHALGANGPVPEDVLQRIYSPDVTYQQRRDLLRGAFKQSQAENPKAYFGGELAGSFAAPIPGAKVFKGPGLLPALANTAVTGAGVGAATGLGTSEADLTKGELGQAAKDVGKGAAIGAVVAPALHLGGTGIAKTAGAVKKFVAPSVPEATKAAERWIVKDINGEVRGASTPTARKQLADDAENAGKLILRDKELAHAIDKATEQNVDELEQAGKVVRDRLDTIGKRLPPNWKKIDEVQPLTSGEVVNPLRQRAQDLRDTGNPDQIAEGNALDKITDGLVAAKAWGARKGGGLSPDVERAVTKLETLRTASTKPTTIARINDQIANLKAEASGFDPTHAVPSEQLQNLWSRTARLAFKSEGGINGTPAFEAKLDVASHIRDIRDDLLARAAQTDEGAAAVDALLPDLRDFSALKRVETVLEQRTNSAKATGGGASVPAGAIRKIKEFKRHPVGTTLGAVAEAGVAAKKWIDTRVARKAIDAAANPVQARSLLTRIIESPPGRAGAAIMAAIRAGIPRAVAMEAAEQRQAAAQ